jgi:hypothetical protein
MERAGNNEKREEKQVGEIGKKRELDKQKKEIKCIKGETFVKGTNLKAKLCRMSKCGRPLVRGNCIILRRGRG